MSAITDQLARALAEAVKSESEKFEDSKKAKAFYLTPGWYQRAVMALDEYDQQQETEQNRVTY